MTWTRRDAIKALSLGAGAGLLAPFLRQVHAVDAGRPRRFVIFVEGNGIEPTALLSSATSSALAAAGSDVGQTRYLYKAYEHDSPVVTANAGLGSALCLGALRGEGGSVSLEDRAAVILGLSSKITGGGHSTEYGALSCTRSQVGVPAGQTIDAYLASLPEVHAQTPFKAVRLGIVGKANKRLNYATCAFGARKAAPIIADPSTAFNTLFGSVATGAGRVAFTDRSQLLDFAAADVRRTLESFSGNSIEREKLERYLNSLETMTTRQQTITAMETELLRVKPNEPSADPLYTSQAPLERLRAQADIATAALLGGLTNVVVVAVGTGTANFSLRYESLRELFPGGDILGGHDVRHAAEDNKQAFVDILYAITRLQVGLMADIARQLEATPEAGADGSMLDHTVMLYMSDNGEKHHSRAEEWPMLMIGGQKLGMATDGRSVVVPRVGHANNRQVSNVFNALGHAAGQDLNTFGAEGDKRIAEGPLSEIRA